MPLGLVDPPGPAATERDRETVVSISTSATQPAGVGIAAPRMPAPASPAPLPGAAIAAALNGGEMFTDLAALLSGEEIRFHADGAAHVCTLTRDERSPLIAAPGVQGIRRTGILRTGSGRDVARVTSVYLANRVDSEAALRELYMTGAPLGQVLAPLGAVRRSLGAMVITEGVIAVRSRGLLSIGRIPVALAEEEVFRSFAVAP
jgi:hypothetical protein